MPERSDYLPSATARTARATAGAFGGSEWVCVDSARAGMDKPPGATPLPSYKPGALDHLAEISAHGLRFAPILA